MQAITERALNGRGDAIAGEWRERGNAYHLRRRLSAAECALADNLSVCDLRDSDRGGKRLGDLFAKYPYLHAIAKRIGESP
jgi:hypothetical protein